MNTNKLASFGNWTRVTVVLALIVVAAAYFSGSSRSNTEITAYFPNSSGLYEGDYVKVLGVKVGTVTSIDPEGDRVRVRLTVDDSQPIPADARAAIVSPSLVSGRFVQLTPVYLSGDKMEDGAVIDLEETAVPVSFDQVKKQLTDLSTALGPNGPTSKEGALNEAITVLSDNLAPGSAEALRASLGSMREAAETLSSGRGDLFTTIANLDKFTRNLAVNDAQVRGFTNEIAGFSQVLDENRTQLTKTVAGLESALGQVAAFVDDNRDSVTTSVSSLNDLTGTLAAKSNTLASVLHVAPHSLAGLYNIVESRAITGRVALANLDSTAELVCGAILGVGGTSAMCQQALGPLLEVLGLTALPGSAGAGLADKGELPKLSTVQPPGPLNQLSLLGEDSPFGGLLDLLVPGGAS